VADDPRQPVAIRVTRPYQSEDEFLEKEIETLTRTSVVLVGAQSRPQGVILRFEVTLLDGVPILRGEGRVVAFKPRALGDLPGLTLRFTRLDAKSKALVDRAAAIRDARARAMLQAAMGESDYPPPSSIPPPSIPASVQAPSAAAIRAPLPVQATTPQGTGVAPANRDVLLDRLRNRAKALTPDTVARILKKRAR
jgi:molecular chaperone DnaK